MITAAELLHGSDADFVVNTYLAVLGRWPEEGGFQHHLAAIAGRPELRLETLARILRSEEGKLKARPVSLDDTPIPAEQALAAQLRLRTEALRDEMAALREAAAGASPALAGEVAALGADLAALRSEMRERMAALEALLAGRIPAQPSLSPAISVDYVNDVVEAAQAQLGRRLRAIEAKLLS